MLSVTRSTTNKPTTYRVAVLVVVLFALMVTASLFVAADKPHEVKAQVDSCLPTSGLCATTQSTLLSSAVLAPEASVVLARGSLDNDTDNDGQYDGIVDPLAIFVSVLLLIILLGSLLLAVFELPNRGIAHRPLLERPG